VTAGVPPALRAAARARGFPGDDDALGALVRYVAAVVEAGREVNLTGAKTPEDALDTLAVPSLVVGAAWPEGGAPRLAVDLGSGNGLPGVAVALAWPSCRVLLVERRAKKARAVEACLAAAGIRNATTAACDGRELLRERPEVRGAADLVTVRAVGSLAETTRMAAPWLAPGGRVVHWKAFDLDGAERAEGERAARAEGLAPLPDRAFEPGRPGPGRLVLYERPRRAG
jgi:16S rRNA G527 N7-methylase RsmG